MESKQINIAYSAGDDYAEIDPKWHQLIKDTLIFSAHAYAPYSNFQVSAGLQFKNGLILKGANVENASYPVSICAERTLISFAATNHPQEIIETLVVYVDKDVPQPVPPCGLCRQTLLEIEKKQQHPIRLIMIGKDRRYIILERCSDLLPLAFTNDFL